MTRWLAYAAGVALAGCIDQRGAQRVIEAILPDGARPEVMPRLVNKPPPFVYPRAQYDTMASADVLLRLWIDTSGLPVRDSTVIREHAAHIAFDSAALAGARHLQFSPAMQNGQPVAVFILLPVHFRRPR